MSTKARIQLLDSLRGIAISGILLLHHIEHFDFYLKPQYDTQWLVKMDKWVWDNLFELVSGKAFALFSLLFGISFWILNENRTERNQEYFFRHFWRMILLIFIGALHLLFFRGDILIMYAVVGIPLIISKYLNEKTLLITSFILLLNPVYLYNILALNLGWELFDFRLSYLNVDLHKIQGSGSFIENVKTNFSTGFATTLIWSWNVGRFFTIPGLFFLGTFMRRKRWLTSKNLKSWYKVLVASIILFYLFDMIDMVCINQIENKDSLRLLKFMIDTYSKLSLMFIFLAGIVIVWRHNKGQVWIARFSNFGRMALTNYVLMSVIGSVLYYGWGFGLYKHCGALYSFIIGLVCLYIQMLFSNWWLNKYGQGPLEKIWRKLTWINEKK